MGTGSIRLLIVDDHEPWHDFVSKAFRNKPELQVAARVTDGVEAVRQAKDLQPDLILLDIGLPKLNGIEAARQIREVCPHSKILFVSENRSAEIVQAALSAGGSGYVVKSDAGSELLSALKAVLKGKRFISASLGSKFLISTALVLSQVVPFSWIISIMPGIR